MMSQLSLPARSCCRLMCKVIIASIAIAAFQDSLSNRQGSVDIE